MHTARVYSYQYYSALTAQATELVMALVILGVDV